MSWFRKRAPEPCPRRAAVAELQAWRPIGGHFQYLGRDCVVTGHYSARYFPRIGTLITPGLHADYADNRGVIHGIEFSLSESIAIVAAQP